MTTIFKSFLVFCFIAFSISAYAQDPTPKQPNIYYDRTTAGDTTKNQSQIFRTRQTENPEQKEILEKIFVGGNLGLSLNFGNAGVFYVYVSPMIGYHLTDNLNIAVGPLYDYYQTTYSNVKYKTNIWGPRFFIQQKLFKSFYIHGEYEGMSVYDEASVYGSKAKNKTWITNPMIGGAFVSQVGERSFYSFTILYNTNYQVNQNISPYGSPLVIRAGLFFNLK